MSTSNVADSLAMKVMLADTRMSEDVTKSIEENEDQTATSIVLPTQVQGDISSTTTTTTTTTTATTTGSNNSSPSKFELLDKSAVGSATTVLDPLSSSLLLLDPTTSNGNENETGQEIVMEGAVDTGGLEKEHDDVTTQESKMPTTNLPPTPPPPTSVVETTTISTFASPDNSPITKEDTMANTTANKTISTPVVTSLEPISVDTTHTSDTAKDTHTAAPALASETNLEEEEKRETASTTTTSTTAEMLPTTTTDSQDDDQPLILESKSTEEARLLAHELAQQHAEEGARLQAEQEPARQEAEAQARAQAEEQARLEADQEEQRLEMEQLAQVQGEEQARVQADQEPARIQADQQAMRNAQEEAISKAETDATMAIGSSHSVSRTTTTTLDTTNTDVVSDPVDQNAQNQQSNEETITTNSTAVEHTASSSSPSSLPSTSSSTTDPVNTSGEMSRQEKKNLQASYQEIRLAKKRQEEEAKRLAEEEAEAQRQAKEKERLESIQRLEKQRKEIKAQEYRKAQQEQQEAARAAASQRTTLGVTPNPASGTVPVTTKTTTPTLPPTPTKVVPTSESSPATFILVLVSKSFGTVAQRNNQDRAITTLQGLGIPVQEIDGSDPTNKDRRSELFGISGLRGSYPQFFKCTSEANGTVSTTFLGDYDAFQYMSETDELSKIIPPLATPTDTKEKKAESQTTTTPTKRMLVLVSKSFGTLDQRANQDRAITMLKAKGIPFEEINGGDPALKDRRNELFGISGVRGKYPQFFAQSGTETTFVGDYETIQHLNEAGTLGAEFSIPSESRDTFPESSDSTIRKKLDRRSRLSTDSALIPDETFENEFETDADSPSTMMIVLVSKSFGTLEQRTNQDRAITMLQAKGIPFEEIDGGDPACKDRRNELFGISGVRGKYPQFFIKSSEETTYVGDFEAIQQMNEAGTLGAEFTKDTNSREVPIPKRPSSISRFMSSESAIIPNERFENEFDPDNEPNLIPTETIENEPQSAGLEGQSPRNREIPEKDMDKDIPKHTSVDLNIAIGILAVSVCLGIWFASRH